MHTGRDRRVSPVTRCFSFSVHVSFYVHARRRPRTRTNARTQLPSGTGSVLRRADEQEETRKSELEAKEKRIAELEQKAHELERRLMEECVCPKKMKDARNVSLEDTERCRVELETKSGKIADLEGQLVACKGASKGSASFKLENELREEKESWRREMEAKNGRIKQLEEEIASLKGLMNEAERSGQNDSRSRDKNGGWEAEIVSKNRRIAELEQEMESLENFLREHADSESMRDLEIAIERKSRRIEELEDTVAEFEDFLKQNPDVKELHDLRCRVTAGERRIQELERWIQKNGEGGEARIGQERIIELEEMVTQLEDYVREHNVDVLKGKLQDRECRINQLQDRVGYLEKEILRVEEKRRGKDGRKDHQDGGTTTKVDGFTGAVADDGGTESRETEQRMKKMEHAICEKDNKIQEYEQQIAKNEGEIANLRKETTALRKELSEYDDIGVLKEEIRVRDERVRQLEDEVDSLERAFSERIDLEQIEELVNVVKEKEDKEAKLSRDLLEKRNKIEELSVALRETVVIVSESERKLKNEEHSKREALQRIATLEQRIASMQTASALKCISCQPLLSKLQKYEEKLEQLTEERTAQLEDLCQMKREALKAAVTNKDAHLALLEHSGIKTAAQFEQAEQLKADRKWLLEKLKKEDEKSIESSVETSAAKPEETLLAKVLEATDDEDTLEDCSDSSSLRSTTTNGDGRAHLEKTANGREAGDPRDRRSNGTATGQQISKPRHSGGKKMT